MIYSVLKGRIGNNLFQIAAGYTLASRIGTGYKAYIPDFILPEPDRCTLKEYLGQFSNTLLRKIEFTGNLPESLVRFSEPADLSYRELSLTDNMILEGYFQSEKYFDRDLVRDLFSVDPATERYISGKYRTLLDEGVISINVRRGDFVKQPHLHPVCSMEYFRSAIRYFGKDKRFIVISDDIDWCRKKFIGDNFHFIADEPPLIDLYLQTMCSGNIISNSTFSWWGAWLNPAQHRIVIAPGENWTGKLHPFGYSEDLLPDSWIRMKNPQGLRSRIIVSEKQLVSSLVRIKKRIIKKDGGNV